MTASLPDFRAINPNLTGPSGQPVVMFEVVDVSDGDEVAITFEGTNSTWRQGVWIATSGILEVNDASAAQFTLWTDTAPPSTRVRVRKSDGKLRLYNVWDSGRGLGDHESQSATSGMIVEDLPDGDCRYRCNDIGWEPAWDKLVFRVSVS